MFDRSTDDEINIFQEYLRIPSVHPNIDYEPCVSFLTKQAESLELPCTVIRPGRPQTPIVIISWYGTEPHESSIMLNSHMDVVPVMEENWTHPPFAAEIDASGKIFARGTQDMKSVGMQYLAAIYALKREKISLKRTIHVVYSPDEEIAGLYGIQEFVKTAFFQNMNLGFSLDEGIASPNDTCPVFYGERCHWSVQVFCSNRKSVDADFNVKNTGGEQFAFMMKKFLEFRDCEVKKLEDDSKLELGDVTTVNLTILEGDSRPNGNEIPFKAVFDIRISVNVDVEEFEKQINGWKDEAGDDVTISYGYKFDHAPITAVNDSNPYWIALKTALEDDLKMNIKPMIFPGNTDSFLIRKAGLPAIGFSPILNTPVLLHDHDEYITVDTYLSGIEAYKKIICRLGNI